MIVGKTTLGVDKLVLVLGLTLLPSLTSCAGKSIRNGDGDGTGDSGGDSGGSETTGRRSSPSCRGCQLICKVQQCCQMQYY